MKSYLYIYNPSYLLATLRTSEKDGQPPPRSASVTHAHTISRYVLIGGAVFGPSPPPQGRVQGELEEASASRSIRSDLDLSSLNNVSVSVAALTTEAEAIAKGELLRLRGGDSVPSGKVSTQLDASMAVLQSFVSGGSLRALGGLYDAISSSVLVPLTVYRQAYSFSVGYGLSVAAQALVQPALSN
ncbi:hypothetical protein THAOC_18023 [Thalassiosira oceanica]|uniref:Uncharacterized protein n=1 Tax=Thalassiosira oceanica TaxID=159749 RepID=K0ST59_THAOC|nr:hypothetical protein THAOC_18023 [Thalassiosira oceanica]|eukprot:EJK61482.1 hypothetical protein THAOC_18023 [Thalassiosira oceanica]